DPSRVTRPDRRVHPREMEVVSAPVAGVAVPANPAPGCDRAVFSRLGQMSEVADLVPGAALGPVRDDVGGQADRVLTVAGVDGIGRVPVGDEDVEATLHPADVREQATVDLLAGEPGNRHEAPAMDRLAQMAVDPRASHR